jgi:hypothetical protein
VDESDTVPSVISYEIIAYLGSRFGPTAATAVDDFPSVWAAGSQRLARTQLARRHRELMRAQACARHQLGSI